MSEIHTADEMHERFDKYLCGNCKVILYEREHSMKESLEDLGVYEDAFRNWANREGFSETKLGNWEK